MQKIDLQERVREEVHRRYGANGLRILEMGSTGVINYIVYYLSTLKMRKGYDFLEMRRLFDKILDRWKDITIFVKAEDEINHIKIKCLELLGGREFLFFVFAYGSAVKPAVNAIASLNNEGELKSYLFFAKRGPME